MQPPDLFNPESISDKAKRKYFVLIVDISFFTLDIGL